MLFEKWEEWEKQIPLIDREEFEKLVKEINTLLGIDFKMIVRGLKRNRNFRICIERKSDLDLELVITRLWHTYEEFQLEISTPSGTKKWRVPFKWVMEEDEESENES